MIEVVIAVLTLTILIVLAYRFWKPMPKRDIPPTEARLYFFYTDWCGWSKKAQPEWKKLEETVSTNPYFGKTHVELIPVNAEENRALADEYEVEGYPTILLERREGITPFTKKVTYDNLLMFLRQSLGKERASL
jgi:thiol-disulfide isomerase/thioredoxin